MLYGRCVQRRGGEAALTFPRGGVTFRGGGFDDAHRAFFTVGRQFRQVGQRWAPMMRRAPRLHACRQVDSAHGVSISPVRGCAAVLRRDVLLAQQGPGVSQHGAAERLPVGDVGGARGSSRRARCLEAMQARRAWMA
jgi:hypothetical protein